MLSHSLKAQVSPFSFTLTADSMIYYVNKSGIKLIYDRVLPYARLAVFANSDTSSVTHFEQAAFEIYGLGLSSAYTPSYDVIVPGTGTDGFGTPPDPVIIADPAPPIDDPIIQPLLDELPFDFLGYTPLIKTLTVPNPDILSQIQKATQVSGTIPLGLMLYDFHYLDRQSVSLGLLAFDANNRLKDVPNRPRSPFVAKRLFLASPMVSQYKGASVIFRYDPAMFFFNTLHSYTVLDVCIDQGVYKRIPLTTATNISFTGITTGNHIDCYSRIFTFINYANDLPNYHIFKKSNMYWTSDQGTAYDGTEPIYEIPGYVGGDYEFPFSPQHATLDSIVLYGSVLNSNILGSGANIGSCLNVESRHVIRRKQWCSDPSVPSGERFLVATAYPSKLTGQGTFVLSTQNIDLTAKPIYTITDNYGKVWQSGPVDKADMEILVTSLPKVSALYQINIQSDKQRAFTRIGIVR